MSTNPKLWMSVHFSRHLALIAMCIWLLTKKDVRTVGKSLCPNISNFCSL